MVACCEPRSQLLLAVISHQLSGYKEKPTLAEKSRTVAHNNQQEPPISAWEKPKPNHDVRGIAKHSSFLTPDH
jgi:hypothetical protein